MNEQTEAQPEYTHTSDTGKRYYYESPGVRVYESGTKYQEGKGIIASPKDVLITSETAPDFVKQREAHKYQLAVNGVKRALVKNGKYVDKLSHISDGKAIGLSDDRAIEAVAEAITEHALDKYAPGSAHVKGKLVDMLDMMPDKRQVKLEDKAGNSLSGSPEALERVLAAIERMKARGDAIDGEVMP